MTPDDKEQQRLGQQQSDNDIERENRAYGNFEAIGQRLIGAREPEDDKDRQSDPMPVLGERRLDAPLAGILIDKPEKPTANIPPRPKDDEYDKVGNGHAI